MTQTHFNPENRPQIGDVLAVQTNPSSQRQRKQPPAYIMDMLIAGLRVTERSLDFVAMSRDLIGPSKEVTDHDESTPRHFGSSSPIYSTGAYIDGIEYEAHQTIHQFNEIVRRIGGVPVKIQLESEQPAVQGVIIGLRGYQQGEWVYAFKNYQHQNGIDLWGVSERLHEWHTASHPELAEDLKSE